MAEEDHPAGGFNKWRRVMRRVREEIGVPLVLPGQNYAGLNERMDLPVLNRLDAISRLHDIGYEHYERMGIEPKLYWLDVDTTYRNKLMNLMPPLTWQEEAALAYINLKYAASYFMNAKGKLYKPEKLALTGKWIRDAAYKADAAGRLYQHPQMQYSGLKSLRGIDHSDVPEEKQAPSQQPTLAPNGASHAGTSEHHTHAPQPENPLLDHRGRRTGIHWYGLDRGAGELGIGHFG